MSMTETPLVLDQHAVALSHIMEQTDYLLEVVVPDIVQGRSDDPTPLALLLARLVALRGQLTDTIQEVEDQLIVAMGKEWTMEIPGLGIVQKHSGKKRTKWQHDKVYSTVKERVVKTPFFHVTEDGERRDTTETAELVVDAVSALANPSWRTTALQQWDIDPDEYCETSVGRRTVQLPPVEHR